MIKPEIQNTKHILQEGNVIIAHCLTVPLTMIIKSQE